MKSIKPVSGLLARAPLATAVAVALLAAPAAQAFEFQKGGLTGSLDTTVSYGISVRTEDADPNLIGKAYFNPLLCTQNAIGTVVPPNANTTRWPVWLTAGWSNSISKLSR